MTDKIPEKKRLLVKRYFLIIFMVTGAILAGTIIVLYNLETKDYLSRIEIEEQAKLKTQFGLIAHSFEDVVSDLRFLSKQNELLHMLKSEGESYYKDALAKEYLVFSRQKHKYEQIRFIDETGMERVRINFNNGSPVIVPDFQLKPKGNRYYFKNSLALAREEVFVSPLDLNVEKGEIEIPFRPVIRFGTPVFDSKGNKRGIIVLNYLGEKLINTIKQASKLSLGDIMLVNSDSYWLLSPNADDEWGFMIEKRKDRNFSTDFPDQWKEIYLSKESQIYSKQGLFTAVTIYPMIESLKLSSDSSQGYGDGVQAQKGDVYFWKMISHIPKNDLKKGTQSLLIKLFFLAGTLFLLASIPTWMLAQAIVRRKLQQMELFRSANYDQLTDLPNRSLFMDRLNQTLKQSKRYERKFALLFIDLDGFKSVNDTLGHDAGDELLIKVSERLLACVRESDTVARLGGDEFTVILSTITSSDNAETVAQQIIKKLSIPFTIQEHEAQIGASIGISMYPDSAVDTEILLKKADDAMYLAKKQGKNDYRLSTS